MTVQPLRAGKTSELLLKFLNPTQHQTSITLLPLDLMEPAENESAVVVKESTVEGVCLRSAFILNRFY